MSNFVWDGTSVATNKTDRFGSTPASDSLVASEWNAVAQAAVDLRTAIKTPRVHVKEYGAVGDGVTNDATAIQNALNAAVSADKPLEFEPRKTYKVNTEILHSTVAELIIIGNRAVLEAGAAIRSPFAVTSGANVLVDRLEFRGGRLSTYAAYFSNASASEFDHCLFYQGLVDGAHVNDTCDRMAYNRCRFERNGKVYTTTSGYAGPLSGTYVDATMAGTVEVTADGGTGQNTIVGTGTTFTGKGLRRGDWVSVHATAPGGYTATWLQVESVTDATHILCTLHPQVAAISAGKKFSLHVGDGLSESVGGRGDRNVNELHGCNFLGNAGSGYMMNGLYGSEVNSCIFNANGAFPITIGIATADPVYGAVLHGDYFEGNGARDNFAIGCAFDVEARGSRVGARDNNDKVPFVANSSFASGTRSAQLNQADPGRTDPIGASDLDYVPAAVISDGSYAKGKIYGQNYAQNAVSTRAYQQIKESQSAVLQQVISVENAGADTNSVGRKLNVINYASGGAADCTQSANRYLDAVFNNGTQKYGVGAGGDIRLPSTDSSGSPGATTIDKPMGCAAFASSAATVTITNALARTDSIIELTMLGDPTASAGVWVSTRSNGSFVVSRNTAPASALAFMFTVKNPI